MLFAFEIGLDAKMLTWHLDKMITLINYLNLKVLPNLYKMIQEMWQDLDKSQVKKLSCNLELDKHYLLFFKHNTTREVALSNLFFNSAWIPSLEINFKQT